MAGIHYAQILFAIDCFADKLKHDPEKWMPVFGKDHAQITSQSEIPNRSKIISL
jgi:hypothetical protein